MRKLISTCLPFLLFYTAYTQEIMTSDILQRVLYIKNGAKTGTAFFVTIDKKTYVITAKHLFVDSSAFNSEVEIEGWQNKSWLKLKGKLLFDSNKDIDIAIIDINQSNLETPTYDLSSKGMSLSQDCFFLGFPYGFKMDEQPELNNGMALPFIKKGIISAWIVDSSKVFRIYLDGHNNPGFSGGPVVITNANSNRKSIIGVVSGYITDASTKENTGIVVVYSIKHVFDILNRKQ